MITDTNHQMVANGAVPNGATSDGATSNGATPNGATPNGATPDGAALDAATAALRRLVLSAHELRQRWAASLGIGVTDTLALSHVAEAGPMSACELARRTGVATSSMTTVMDRLEHAGLAERTSVSGDRRSLAIMLTPRGRSALDRGGLWARTAMLAASGDDLEMVTRKLDALSDALRGAATSDALPGGPDVAG